MLIPTITAGFTLGLLGSLHCVGMCGPLALSLPNHHSRRNKQIISSVIYNFGRVITYSLLGLIFGMIGKGFSAIGFQQLFSILAGSVMMILTILYFGYKQSYQPQWFKSFTWALQSFIAASMQRSSGALTIGIANGLLPCGMVYTAIAGALVSNSVLSSAIFMGSYGLATVPAMLLLMISGSGISLQLRVKMRKLTPYVMMFVALLLILRGMNLGIPYISPQFQTASTEAALCH
jgi:uncharacterized protein